MFSRGGPGFSQEWDGGTYRTTYLRPNEPDGIDPIVLERTFHHGRPTYVEISEEFRLLFDLYEDRQSGIFYQAEDDGLETPVIRTAPEKVTIRSTLLRRYLAARQVALALEIDSEVWLVKESDVPMSALPAERRVTTRSEILHFYSGHFSANRPFSRLLGKKIILPPPREECDIWPFKAPKEFLVFIIDEDERGYSVEHICNPDDLANNFGKNPGAPHYLTPVFFQREVLRKYYENSDRYEVGDGHIVCQGTWHLRADNNHPEHVVVFLGDLGRDLPTSEQRHWRPYNIKPEERNLSQTALRRSFLGEWADAELPEHVFKTAYASANEAWQAAFGWPLFIELHLDDRHVLASLRLSLSNNFSEFDSQVLNLAKLIVDSLNEKQITEALSESVPKGEKGIAKLERLLTEWQYPHVERDIALLRTIQGVRSRGAAHLKSSDYNLAAAGLDPSDLHASFTQLLERSTESLGALAALATARET
jgi:hypothetical protein